MIKPNILQALAVAKNNYKLSHLYLLNAPFGFDINKDLKTVIEILTNFKISSLDHEHLPPFISFIDGSVKNIEKETLENAFYNNSFVNQYSSIGFNLLVIKNIENASTIALNSILKSIEEPVDNLIILMTTNKINSLLPTILSRAQQIKVFHDDSNTIYNEFLKNNIFNEFAAVASFISFDFLSANAIVNSNFSSIYNELLETVSLSLKQKNPALMYLFLTKYLKKDDTEQNERIFNSLKFIFTAFYRVKNSNIPTSNQFISKSIALNHKILDKKPSLLTFIVDIEEFKNNISSKINFELEKVILLNKLMELYNG
ncbi:hypothetical protein ACJA23_03415 [Mycoplasma corogypsi]|uniref:hypothetical protein n=1 Tax=Mycoplasma corogypsi TaxID=2106 RepID=UPI003872F9DF